MGKTIVKDDNEKSKQAANPDQKELDELKKRNEELETQVKRLLADYQNLEKRTQAERGEIIQLANKELLLRILPALDTLMLAAKHITDEGLRLSIAQFHDALRQEGVEKIETAGKQFDPHTMECFETVEGEEGKVIEEAFAGYKLFDKIIRPAQVKVGKRKEEINGK